MTRARAGGAESRTLGIPNPWGSVRKLVVADDTEDIRVMLRLVLQGSYEILAEAPDGQAALHAWQAHRDDVFALVLDHNMPHMTGLDVARHVLAEEPDMRVVLFSANCNDELRAAAAEVGVRAVLDKERLIELADHPALAA